MLICFFLLLHDDDDGPTPQRLHMAIPMDWSPFYFRSLRYFQVLVFGKHASFQTGMGQTKAIGKKNGTTDVAKVVGEIKKVRKHGSNLIFLTVQLVSKNTEKKSLVLAADCYMSKRQQKSRNDVQNAT